MGTINLKSVLANWIAITCTVLVVGLPQPDSTDAAGTRLISHRQTLSEVITNPGDGFNNAGPDGHSRRPAISADGRYVVFESDAGYFDEMEIAQVVPPVMTDSDIFLYDKNTDTTTRISAGTGGAKANGESFKADISPNGNWVVFESDATNLVPGDTNGKRDIFRYNRQTAQMARVSLRSTGDQTTYDSTNASVADNGSVAFQTPDSQMTTISDTNGKTDVFMKPVSGQVKLVSIKQDGSAAAAGTSSQAAISGYGSAVAFKSNAGADELTGQPDSSPGDNLYSRSFGTTPQTKLVSANAGGNPSGWYLNTGHAVSQDGRFIVFSSLADDLVPGLPDKRTRLFIRDMSQTGVGKIMVVAQDTTTSITQFRYPDISPDGEWIAYQLDSPGPEEQIAFKPRNGGMAQVASVSYDGVSVTDGSNLNPAVSNTVAVAFESDSLKLKQNYLGRGLASWNELWTEAETDKLPCDPDECRGISLRETSPGSVEPGQFDVTPEVNGGELLVKVEKSSSKTGSATDMTVTLKRPFNYHEFEDVEFLMPAGLSANTNVEKCSQAQANQPDPDNNLAVGCPEGSQVGTVHADVELIDNLHDISTVMGNKYKKNPDGSFAKDGMDGGVYFGEPQGSEAGRLYAVLFDPDLLKVPIVVPLSITTVAGENYRFKIMAGDIPNAIPDAHVKQFHLGNNTFIKNIEFGKVYPNIERIVFSISSSSSATTNGYPFLRNPTFSDPNPDIEEAQKGVEATIDNYGGSQNQRFLDFLVVPDSLTFTPQLEVELSPNKPNQVTDMKTTLTRSVGAAAYAGEADLRRVVFTMPKGIWVNGTADVSECKSADVDAWKCGQLGGSGQPVGSATAYSPLLEDDAPYGPSATDDTLTGDAFLIESPEGKPMKLAVFLKGLVNVRLDGEVKMTAGRRIQAIFDAPPLPVSKFELQINDLLTTGGVGCDSGMGELEADATITSWTKQIAPVSLKPKVTVNTDCTGAAQSPFGPQIAVTSDDHTAGASPGKLELSVTRKASDDPLTDFNITLPQGMVGDLDATPAKCALSQAEGAGCPGSSKIGTVEATAQIFNNKTITVEGGLYNAAPSTGEFGRFIASFNLPELAGGGKLVLKSAVNPINNAQAIVTKVAGAPPEFNITDIKMSLLGKTASGADGPLLINPTFASNGSFTLDAISAHSLKANSSAPYPVTGSLGFTPHLSAGLSTTKLGAKPTISTEIGQQVQETAIQSMRLSFKGFGLDIAKGLSGCSALDRGMGTCPPASKVADITAHSWLIPTPLKGSLYLGEGAKTAFMSLNGPITLNVEGDVSIDAAKAAVSVDINKGLPPISGSRIQATVNEGLFKNPDKCGQSAEIALDSTSYAGQSHSESKKIDYCKGASSTASLKVKLRPRKTNSYTKASFTLTQSEKKKAKKLKSLKIKLGKGKKALRASTKALKRKTRRSRKSRTIGTLSLSSAKKGRSVKAKVQVKRGRIYISPSTKQLKRYRRTLKRLSRKGKRSSKAYRRAKSRLKSLKKVHRYLKKKTRARISKGKLKLTGLPTTDAYYRVSLTLNGKRFHTLRNPKRPGKVTFNAKAKTSSGSTIKAGYSVKLKK